MLNLDLRTVILMSGIMAVLLSIVMLFARLSYPRTLRGLDYWVLAPILVSVATFLFGARGQIPDIVSVLGANVLLLTGVLLFHLGSQRFFGLQPSYRVWLPIMLAVLSLLVWFSLIRPDFNVRVQLVCLLWIGILLANMRVIWRHGSPSFATRYTMVVLLAHAGVLLLRLLATLLPVTDEGLLTPTRVQTIYVIGNAMMILALSLGLLLLAAERVHGELDQLATRDPLTGALKQRVLIEAGQQELERCREHGCSMALLVLDIAHFDVLDGAQGQQPDDRALLDFADRVHALLRRSDLLARHGGRSFLLLLPETTGEEALALAGRIRADVTELQQRWAVVMAGIGVTANRAGDTGIDALLARADRALRQAKTEGRNRIVAV